MVVFVRWGGFGFGEQPHVPNFVLSTLKLTINEF